MADQSPLDYFTQIDSREGLFVWMVMLLSFLFGFLIAYLLRSGRVRRLKQELAQQQQATQAVQATLAGLQTQLQDRTREHLGTSDKLARSASLGRITDTTTTDDRQPISFGHIRTDILQ